MKKKINSAEEYCKYLIAHLDDIVSHIMDRLEERYDELSENQYQNLKKISELLTGNWIQDWIQDYENEAIDNLPIEVDDSIIDEYYDRDYYDDEYHEEFVDRLTKNERYKALEDEIKSVEEYWSDED